MPGKNNQNFDILNRLRRMKNNDRNGRDLVKLFYEEAKRFPLLTHCRFFPMILELDHIAPKFFDALYNILAL